MPVDSPIMQLMLARLSNDAPTYLKVHYTRQWAQSKNFRQAMLDVANVLIRKDNPVGYILRSQVFFNQTPRTPEEEQDLVQCLEKAYAMGDTQTASYLAECQEKGIKLINTQKSNEELHKEGAAAGNPASMRWELTQCVLNGDKAGAYDWLIKLHKLGFYGATYCLAANVYDSNTIVQDGQHEVLDWSQVTEQLLEFVEPKHIAKDKYRYGAYSEENFGWAFKTLAQLATDPEKKAEYLKGLDRIAPWLKDKNDIDYP